MLLYCWWECKLIKLLWKAMWRFPKKLKRNLVYDSEMPLLGIDPKELKTLIQKKSLHPYVCC